MAGSTPSASRTKSPTARARSAKGPGCAVPKCAGLGIFCCSACSGKISWTPGCVLRSFIGLVTVGDGAGAANVPAAKLPVASWRCRCAARGGGPFGANCCIHGRSALPDALDAAALYKCTMMHVMRACRRCYCGCTSIAGVGKLYVYACITFLRRWRARMNNERRCRSGGARA